LPLWECVPARLERGLAACPRCLAAVACEERS
jgi:hypothetical protein